MEIFVIVVAVIAVAAAIILLVLLQLRIKKQTAAEAVSRRRRVQPASEVVEEIALDYPANDGILKTGPPPYRQGKSTF
jgi:flagellar basal body-associated protein FliL